MPITKNAHDERTITAGVISSPGFIMALALLLLNDHLFKELFPGVVTGKLSDFSGLFLVGLLALSLRRLPATVSLTLLALLFIGWKSPYSAATIAKWNELTLWPVQRVEDATDLIALLSLPAAYYYWQRYRSLALACLLRLPLIAATFFAVTATSMIPRYVAMEVPDPLSGEKETSAATAPFCGVTLLSELDAVFQQEGYRLYGPYTCSSLDRSDTEHHVVHRGSYKWMQGEIYFYITYDTATRNASLMSEGDGAYELFSDAERLRRALRDALILRGYYPQEGGVVTHRVPTAYTRLLITQAANADPLLAFYDFDFRRLTYQLDDLLAELGFTPVASPDCGNHAYFVPESICYQYRAGQAGEGDDEIALTSVTLTGYMIHGQLPIELSVVQFGTNAPFTAPALARKLQAQLQTAIPELTLDVVAEGAGEARHNQ